MEVNYTAAAVLVTKALDMCVGDAEPAPEDQGKLVDLLKGALCWLTGVDLDPPEEEEVPVYPYPSATGPSQAPISYALSLVKQINEADGLYTINAGDGSEYGSYQTEEEAQARLTEVEPFLKAADGRLVLSRCVTKVDGEVSLHGPGIDRLHPIAVADILKSEDDGVFDVLWDEAGNEVTIVPAAMAFAVTKQLEENRFTLGPLYMPDTLDAHGEFVGSSDLQKAAWGYVRKLVSSGDNAVYRQHTDEPIGELVEMVTWPYEVTAKAMVPGEGETEITFPAGTVYQGIVWSEKAWEDVKAGRLRGLSLGGRARRVEVG